MTNPLLDFSDAPLFDPILPEREPCWTNAASHNARADGRIFQPVAGHFGCTDVATEQV
jgi:hypothetical protein